MRISPPLPGRDRLGPGRALTRTHPKPREGPGAISALRRAHQPLGLAQTVGGALVVLQLFLVYSRLFEQLIAQFGSLYLVRVISIVALALTAISGGLQRAFSSRAAILLSALTCWLLVATPFSVWRGGSTKLLFDQWLKAYIFYIIVAGLLVTAGQCRRAIYAIGCGALGVGLLSSFRGYEVQDRLQIAQSGTFSNPNDLAFFLVVSIPPCLLMLMNGRGMSPLRFCGAAGVALLFLLVFRTGSRGGLIIAVLLAALLFLKCPREFKVPMIAGVAVVALLVAALSPQSILDRYNTILPGSGDGGISRHEESALESTTSRLNLLKTSLKLTLLHPVFGVGPGMFDVAASDERDAKKLGIAWKQTHNTYTQISSEAGIPAFLLFAATLIFCLRTSYRVYRALRGHKELAHISNAAFCVFASLVVYAANGMFMGIAYSYYLPTLAGLTVAVDRCARTELRLLAPSAAPGENARPPRFKGLPRFGLARAK